MTVWEAIPRRARAQLKRELARRMQKHTETLRDLRKGEGVTRAEMAAREKAALATLYTEGEGSGSPDQAAFVRAAVKAKIRGNELLRQELWRMAAGGRR